MKEQPYLIKDFALNCPYYSETAIRTKIRDGVWKNGQEYVKAPDGHIYIIKSGVIDWIFSQMPKIPKNSRYLDR